MDWDNLLSGFLGAIVGGVIAIFGGIIGGWMTYRFELKRTAAEKRAQWIKNAREWQTREGHESLREADLHRADPIRLIFLLWSQTGLSRPICGAAISPMLICLIVISVEPRWITLI